MADYPGFLSSLTDLGVIAVTGEEGPHFLHNQLTNDVEGLDAHGACLAGYCTPKGRLLATMLVWKSGDGIMLALPRVMLPAFQKRLQMFVLRAKVKLEDLSETLALAGIAMPTTEVSGLRLPEAPYRTGPGLNGTLIRVPDAAGLKRSLWVGPADQIGALTQTLSPELQVAPAALWRWTDILAGVPQILEATREQFVPQMVNFELVGGVNFRKGCYPGQEIVARSQYLGKLKRRMQLATVDATVPMPGTELFSDADPDQPCGMLVNAEAGPDGRIACLVEIKTEALSSLVHLGHPQGAQLFFNTLPYSLEVAN